MTRISSSAALLAIGLALAGCAGPGRTPVLADESVPALTPGSMPRP